MLMHTHDPTAVRDLHQMGSGSVLDLADRVSQRLIDFNFVYRRYPAKLLIPVVNVPTSPERKCNIHVYDTALQPIYPRDIILTSLVLVHAGYLFCN